MPARSLTAPHLQIAVPGVSIVLAFLPPLPAAPQRD